MSALVPDERADPGALPVGPKTFIGDGNLDALRITNAVDQAGGLAMSTRMLVRQLKFSSFAIIASVALFFAACGESADSPGTMAGGSGTMAGAGTTSGGGSVVGNSQQRQGCTGTQKDATKQR